MSRMIRLTGKSERLVYKHVELNCVDDMELNGRTWEVIS